MVQSLARGIEILSIIQERGSATIVEVASVLGVDKSTVSRLMATLMHYDMVSIDPVSKKYRLGFRNLYLSEGVKKNFKRGPTYTKFVMIPKKVSIWRQWEIAKCILWIRYGARGNTIFRPRLE